MNQIKIKEIIEIAKEAGREVLEIYNREISIEYKSDKSPLTEADKKSDEIIKSNLKRLYTEIPILSEESKEIPYSKRKEWKTFWLIDPLDGTKEFIKKNGEFTINIALIENKKPVLGVVYVPVKEIIYFTKEGSAFKQIGKEEPQKLPLDLNAKEKLRVVASRSHFNEKTKEFIESLNKEYELVSAGSSLKLCKVAEGSADIYPRLGQTMEWDTAAAHAIVNASGKKVFEYNNEQEVLTEEELGYNKENLLNPFFVVK